MHAKKSTARTILVGPILDSSGVAVTTEVVGSLRITKNGTVSTLNASATLTHDHSGMYKLALTTSDTDTVGIAQVSITNGTNAMAPVNFEVVEAAVYDALYASSAAGYQVPIWASSTSTVALSNTTISTTQAVASVSGAVGSVTGNVGGNVVGSVASVSGNVGGVATGGISSASFAAGAITSTAIASAALNGKGDWSTYSGGDTSGTTTLLSRLSSTRAGYLDNLSGGAVATQSDINALNQSASRRVLLVTVPQYERPESSSSSYTIELRTFDGDGAATDADSTPTLTATGIVTGSLAANLGTATNPATGVYRWTYSVASNATIEQIRFDTSATIGGSAFTLSAYSQVVDFVSSTWTTADRTALNAIYDKLPTNAIADQTLVYARLGAPAGASLAADIATVQTTATTISGKLVGTIATGTHYPQSGDAYARLGVPAGASVSADVAAVKADAASLLSRIPSTLFSGITYLARWLGMLAGKTADSSTLAEIQATTAGTGYNNTTDSLEAQRDNYTAPPSAAAISTQVGSDLSTAHGAGAWGPGTAGSGPYSYTITVDDGTDPLENARVRLVEGADDFSDTTDADGEVPFSLTAKTYSVTIAKDGYSFTPTTLAVSGDGSHTFSMTRTAPAAPDDADKITTRIYCYKADTTRAPCASVYLRQFAAPTGDAGNSYEGAWTEYEADEEGVLDLTLWADVEYGIRRGEKGDVKRFTPAGSAYSIDSFIGR